MHRTRRTRRIAAAVTCVAALLVALAGCGGSSKTNAGTSTAGTTSQAAGTPIKVSVTSIVNSPAVSWPGVFAGAQAAARAINAAGGVGSQHQPIKIVTCDYQLDANKDNLCARGAVSAGVVADVSAADAFTPATTPIFAAAGIPRVALIPFNPSDTTAPDTYPIAGGGDIILRGLGSVLAAQGITKVGWLEPSPPIPANVNLLTQGLKQAGVTLVGTVLLPQGGVSDYAPYAKQVQNLVAKGAQGMVANVSAPFFQLLTTFHQLGGSTKWFQMSQVDSKQIKAAGAIADGVYNVSYLPPASATDLAAVKQRSEEMGVLAAEGVNGASQLDAQSFNAWLGVYALRDLLANAKGPITSKTVNELLRSSRPIRVQNLIDWSPAAKGPAGFANISNDTVWLTKVVNGQEVLARSTPIHVFG